MDHRVKTILPVKRKSKPIPKRSNTETVSHKHNKEDGFRESSDDLKEQKKRAEEFNFKIKQFIEISKYFSSPLKKTASYMCENELVSYPNRFPFEYKRGGITTQHIKFTNLALEPVYVKLYKMIPELEQIKFVNLSISRSKRIPPGLSLNFGFVYNDANDNPISCEKANVIFVASRKTSTPCYQICEIELIISVEQTRKL